MWNHCWGDQSCGISHRGSAQGSVGVGSVLGEQSCGISHGGTVQWDQSWEIRRGSVIADQSCRSIIWDQFCCGSVMGQQSSGISLVGSVLGNQSAGWGGGQSFKIGHVESVIWSVTWNHHYGIGHIRNVVPSQGF